MKNIIPNKLADVMTMGDELAAGAAQYGGTIPLLQNTEEKIRLKIQGLVDAIVGVDAAEAELKTRRNAVRALLRTSREYLILGRDNFKPVLDSTYNEGWDELGLHGSLIIPTSERDVVGLLRSYKGFLTNNPTFEMPDPAKNITAARADALLNQLTAARAAVGAQVTHVQNLMLDRIQKQNILRKCIRATINELGMNLSPLDSRYASFGLNKPGALATPDVPQGVTVVFIGPNAASVKWPSAARATYYRVWQKVVGVDTELIAVGNPADIDFILESLPSNSTIQVAISAVNNGGESQLSEVVTITTQT